MDVYQQITNKIISQIEADPGQWKLPWRNGNQSVAIPRSAAGRFYRGVNILALWASAMEHSYSSPVWATYKQWKAHGAQVRKGEKSELIVYYDSFQAPTDDGDLETRKFAKAFFVFNSAQVDGFVAPAEETPPDEFTHVAHCDDYFLAVGATLRVGGNSAFYSPAADFISVPTPRDFHSYHDYYSILAHEHVHWTGHKSRLDRELKTIRFGSEAYAFEELVAEFGAAFLCASLGLENEPRIDHAQYLASWLQVLKSDKKAIFTAASSAQRAVDFLQAFQPGGEGDE